MFAWPLVDTQTLQLVAGPLSEVVQHGEDSLCAELTQTGGVVLQSQ